MIVECINDNWPSKSVEGAYLPKIIPIKGNLYEVIGGYTNNKTGKYYYILKEISGNFGWNSEKFREVDIDISDATDKKITELPIEVLI
jgi:hypothetical protein